ncbi:MAG: AbrB/MazE/SpoVT family DNA-binding domain-containing protein [Clostridia bacterium]|nr:AbrB/MazE/SpoVT family DNA-binding domain-containing protein [Clostridia bacterium]
MRDTGIVRRIDELGRVVIPKEIRKTLRLKESDPLEIFTDKDSLVIKKYSPISSIGEFAKIVADGLEEITEKVCVITDNDAILYLSKGKMSDIIGKNISQNLIQVLKDRKSIVSSRMDGGTIIPIAIDDDFQSENQIIVPIISNGDCFGACILFDKDKTSHFDSEDVKIVQLGATFLSKQFE